MHTNELTNLMNLSIGRLAETAVDIARKDFSGAVQLLKTLKYQKKAAALRSANEARGVHVPPFIIASIVRACNLKCKGCYDRAKQAEVSGSGSADGQDCSAPELDAASWVRIFGEARDLGVSFILLAGGEPLIKDAVVRECINFPEILFPVFTNGLLINAGWLEYFASARNVIPVFSIEGDERMTDERRGSGVHAKLMQNLSSIKEKKIFYGSSITVTSSNFDCVLSGEYIRGLVDGGSRVFFFVEYVPFDPSTASLVISESQKSELPSRLEKLRSLFSAIFLDFPGDEAAFGGCLASGRGFVHINAAGGVESCPFAPYSDTNVGTRPLSEAISSPMLTSIRALQETLVSTGGCTLFENRNKVDELVAANRAASD